MEYSQKLENLLEYMINRFDRLDGVLDWMRENRKQGRAFSCGGRTHVRTKSKQRIKVLSGRKNKSNVAMKSLVTNETSIFTNYESVSLYNCSVENKDNNKQNDSSRIINLNNEILGFKEHVKNVDVCIKEKQ